MKIPTCLAFSRNVFILAGLSLITACGNKKNISQDKVATVKYEAYFDGEIKPEKFKPCFQGAYYHKLVSSNDYWAGISGKVVLPTVQYDTERANPAKPGQFLDNPSIYIGGRMGGQETDIGMIWEVIREADGSISKVKKAFRPFLRRTEHASGQKAVYENAPASKEYYWYPGEEVYMSIKILSAKKIRFVVEGSGKKFEKDFDCDGYDLKSIGEFKRVNAIDQVANEGKPVKATKTKILNAVWKHTELYRLVNGKLETVPMHTGRFTEMNCPDTKYFSSQASTELKRIGGENISISGAGF